MLLHQTLAPADRSQNEPAPEPPLATDLKGLPIVHQPPANPLLTKPASNLGGLVDQNARQLLVAAPLRQPLHVCSEVLFGVRWSLGPGQLFLAHLVEEGAQLLQTFEGCAKGARREVTVAASPLARRLFEDEHALYTLLGCQRRRESCVACSHHHDIVSVHQTPPASRSIRSTYNSASPPYGWSRGRFWGTKKPGVASLVAVGVSVLRGLHFSNKVGVVETVAPYGDRGEERRSPCLSPG